ncbi:hypothetical protein LINGRAPRIM_LOCUS2521 [Linum grandiflorum]
MNPADRRMYTAAASPDFFASPSGEEARLVYDAADDFSSGASTPPLWRPASPPPQNNYRSLSPASRAQAIARGQRELMEMVSRMPEGCYELSLKDLVEHHHGIEPPPSSTETKLIDGGGGGGKVRWALTNNPVASGARISRSGSLDNGGFLLKMGLPVSSLRSRNNSKKTTKAEKKTTAGDGRVAPTEKSGSGEKEWWKDENGSSAGFSSNSGSRSSKSSSHSHSSSSRCSSRNSNNRG